jgi:hypothetical protein
MWTINHSKNTSKLLRALPAKHLQKNQLSGVPGKTTPDTLATVRDEIQMAEVKITPMCVVSLDLKEAFDRI